MLRESTDARLAGHPGEKSENLTSLWGSSGVWAMIWGVGPLGCAREEMHWARHVTFVHITERKVYLLAVSK